MIHRHSTRSTDSSRYCCTHTQARAVLRRAGPTSKNPGRYFYACPRTRDDPKNCKFFKWEDEVAANNAVAASSGPSSGAGAGVGVGQGRTLGGAPLTPSRRRLGLSSTTPKSAIGEWFSPSKRTPGVQSTLPFTSDTPSKKRRTDSDEDDGGIDWSHVDAESLEVEAEAEAEARTPHRSQVTNSAPSTAGTVPGSGAGAGTAGTGAAATTASAGVKPGTPASRLQERLLAAGAGKRKREDEEDNGNGQKQSVGILLSVIDFLTNFQNPFIDTPSTPRAERTTVVPGSTHSVASITSNVSAVSHDGERQTHPALVPVVASLEGLSEHLARQDRLVRAAEAMKKSMRATIHNLQERVKELEAEVEALKRKG